MKYLILVLMLISTGCVKKSTASSEENRKRCDSVEYMTATKLDDTPIAANCTKGTLDNCGVTLKHCDGGLEYYCLTNVKIKSETKDICN